MQEFSLEENWFLHPGRGRQLNPISVVNQIVNFLINLSLFCQIQEVNAVKSQHSQLSEKLTLLKRDLLSSLQVRTVDKNCE
jgi:hypothetical protein